MSMKSLRIKIKVTSTATTASTSASGDYYIGRIETGEWLQYTLEVGSGAVYDLYSRVASPSAGGIYFIRLTAGKQALVRKALLLK